MQNRRGRKQPRSGTARSGAGSEYGAIADAIGHPTNLDLAVRDTASLVAYLAGREDVAESGIGATGYCMGGAFSLASAGMYPDQIRAAASFHGGDLVTASPVSPHALAPAMRGSLYVAAAENDPSYPPEMAAQLEQSLSRAGVNDRCETYRGAVHGWTMPDTRDMTTRLRSVTGVSCSHSLPSP